MENEPNKPKASAKKRAAKKRTTTKRPDSMKPKAVKKAPAKKRATKATTKSNGSTQSTDWKPPRRPTERVTVAPGELELDDTYQVRVRTNTDAIKDYKRLYEEKAHLPAVRAVRVNGKLRIIDGFHRVEAARLAEQKKIGCVVIGDDEMTPEEALGIALEQNHEHGIRRSRADKREVVIKAHGLGWLNGEDSFRSVAKRIGVSDGLIRKVLKELERGKATQVDAEPDPDADVKQMCKAVKSTRKAAERAFTEVGNVSKSTTMRELANSLLVAAEDLYQETRNAYGEASE